MVSLIFLLAFPVFNFHKVFALLDEFFLVSKLERRFGGLVSDSVHYPQAGEPQETSKRVILERMAQIERLE